ncbi:SPOSA6832_00762 [Sporobolomyces salmonicolor]|uniref:SPOSA6832_00762-mRNA-1:cds n=1 Tax=Sporidiobolus salmonicolor TaxID=5005 RepID=A0A0D6EH76_SPOSA|nr:SPOSA6832_00762 [Sporobolomyces salmonicolor]
MSSPSYEDGIATSTSKHAPLSISDEPQSEPPMRQPSTRATLLTLSFSSLDLQELTVEDLSHTCYGTMINCLGAIAGTLGSIPCCICCPNPYKQLSLTPALSKVGGSRRGSVQQGSVGLVSRFGQFYRSVDPGLAADCRFKHLVSVKVNPFSEEIRQINVKIQVVEIPRQKVMSKDNLQVDIESVIVYRAQTTLRDVVGARNLQSILTEREAVAAEIEQSEHGVPDILLPPELQSSLSSAAQARRTGEAKVIAARAEVDSAKLMREAADILSSPAAIQIRQLETLQAMARNPGTNLLFVPMSLVGNGADSGNMVGNLAMQQALQHGLTGSGSQQAYSG